MDVTIGLINQLIGEFNLKYIIGGFIFSGLSKGWFIINNLPFMFDFICWYSCNGMCSFTLFIALKYLQFVH